MAPDSTTGMAARAESGEALGSEVRYRFGFDIGGTFTDLVLSGSNGAVFTAKRLSDHDNIDRPIVDGLKQILAENNIRNDQVSNVVAGATTAVTNLIIERKGVVTGLITTRGFRDVVEIGRELRYDVDDLGATFPEPVVPRELRVEITERIDAKGRVLTPLDEKEVADAVLQLRRKGAAAIAVCFLHSFRNPVHELRVRAIAENVAPELATSLSSEVLAEIREYERTVVTGLNAYVMPRVGAYLNLIKSGLSSIGVKANLQIMQSNGGIISQHFAERMPIRILESGPAAGALGAAYTAQRIGRCHVLAFDMGGTTAKACLVSDGVPEVTTEFEAARIHRFKKGSGFPVRLPTVDLIEIGAGGGSIAYVDRTGLLKVGPRSAGSNPGPACYGLGGSEPTVTDAALVLGYLDPEGVLSAQVQLRPDLAEQAIATYVAEPLGISITKAANGIHRIVCENMAAAAKIHAVEKGKDLRRFTLLAFGGAGPIHAREVARRSGCKEILVPANAGVFSAIGLLVAPLKVDLVRSLYGRLSEIDWREIEALFVDMASRLTEELNAAGVPPERIEFRRSADLRYVGQGFEVNTLLSSTGLSENLEDEIVGRFHAAYAQQFGSHLEAQPVEALNWRLEAVASAEWDLVKTPDAELRCVDGQIRWRRTFFPDVDEYLDTPVFDQSELTVDEWIEGPALVEQPGSTIVVGPTDRFTIDPNGNVHITIGLPQ